MTIGIIEDDSLLNQALEIALQNAGYYTISAHTRKEALDLLREKVDVFLIDIGLPDGNGIELYQELQMEKRIPAIFLTARDEEKEMLLAFDAGAQDYVVKPFSMKVLMKRLEVVLKRNPEERYMVGELTLYPDRKQVFTGKTENLSDSQRISAPGISHAESGAGADKRKYSGDNLGCGRTICSGQYSQCHDQSAAQENRTGWRTAGIYSECIRTGVSDWRERAMYSGSVVKTKI